MKIETGYNKEVNIIGYKILSGTSEKCKSEKNENGEYQIFTFYYYEIDETETNTERVLQNGRIAGEFNLRGNYGARLVEELDRNANECGRIELPATISGEQRAGKLYLNSIATNY